MSAGWVYAGAFALVAWLSYAAAPSYRFYGPGLLAVGALGALVTMQWRGRPIRGRHWLLPGALVALALVSYPNTSHDYLRYLFDGEMIRVWHASPYVHLPGEFPLDQYSRLFRDAFWVHVLSPYGPLWQAVMVAINYVTGNHLAGGIAALKLTELAGLLAGAWYLVKITGQRWAGFAFLVNPVILLNTVATPHVDVVIAAMLLAAYYHRSQLSRGVLVGAAGLLKVHALVFWPFFSKKPRDVAVLAVVIAGATTAMLVVLKPVVGFDWTAMLRANQGGGVDAMVSLLPYTLAPWARARDIFLASYTLFALSYLALLVAYARGRLAPLSALAVCSLLVPLCLTGLLEPWHFIIPIALLLACEKRVAYWAVLFITALSLRSAVTVAEILTLAILAVLTGWVLVQADRRLDRPPRVLKQLVAAFR